MNQSLNEASIAIKSAEKNRLNHDINILIISRDEYTKQISRLDRILKDAKSKLDLFTKNRRGGEESLNSLTAIGARERQLYYKLRSIVVFRQIFVRC